MASKSMEKGYEQFKDRFEKSFGEGTLPGAELSPYNVISTGSLSLDRALGVGGWVRGRQHEVWGVDSIGKTTLALLGCAEAQKVEPTLRVAWIDMERSLDLPWVAAHGVNLDA